MKHLLTGLILMVLSSQAVRAQVDIHCHMIPDSYLEAITAHGMEMDEGFPIPAWSAEEHLEFMDTNPMITAPLKKSAIR